MKKDPRPEALDDQNEGQPLTEWKGSPGIHDITWEARRVRLYD
jgi:pantothenate kinase-related protein Tda10